MKRFSVYILALAVLFALGYLVVAFVPMRSIFGQRSVQNSDVQMTAAQIHENGASYTVSAEYPQFGIPAIDSQIKKAVEDTVAEFEAYPPNPADSATPQNEFTGRFDKVYIGPDIISFELILSQYTGGAHPMTLLSGMNFDRATGRKLELNDALRLIGFTVGQVSAQASAQFREKFGDAFFSQGSDTNPENFSSFTISATEVTFIFQQYQVAAYAAGPQEISFERK